MPVNVTCNKVVIKVSGIRSVVIQTSKSRIVENISMIRLTF